MNNPMPQTPTAAQSQNPRPTFDDLLRAIKWMRKYPSVLEDEHYALEIDALIAAAQEAAQ